MTGSSLDFQKKCWCVLQTTVGYGTNLTTKLALTVTEQTNLIPKHQVILSNFHKQLMLFRSTSLRCLMKLIQMAYILRQMSNIFINSMLSTFLAIEEEI